MKNPIRAWWQAVVRGRGGDMTLSELQNLVGLAFSRTSALDRPGTTHQLMANKSWAFAANRQIAGRAARVRPLLDLLTHRPGDAPIVQQITIHRILELLREPNLDESGTTFQWRQILQLQTIGRCYLQVIPQVLTFTSPDQKSFVITSLKMMRLLSPDRVKGIPIGLRERAAWEYTPHGRGQSVVYSSAPSDSAERMAWKRKPYQFIIPIVMPSAASIDGDSPIQAGANAFNVNDQLGKLHSNQLKNGLHVGLIFKLKKAIKDPKRFEAATILIKQGIGKAGEPMILPDDTADIAPNPTTNKDMQFVELAELSRKEMLAVLGASDGVIGMVGDVNRATIEGLERIIAIGTVDPLMCLIADAYNRYLLPLFPGQSGRTEYRLRYPTSAVKDPTTEAERLVKLTGGKQIISQNEGRGEMGLEPRAKLNKIAGDDPNPQLGPGAAAQIPSGGLDDKDENPKGKAKTGAFTVREAIPGLNLQGLVADDDPLGTDDGRARAWRAMEEMRVPFEKAMQDDLARVFGEWADEFQMNMAGLGAIEIAEQLGPRQRADALDLDTWRALIAEIYADHGGDIQLAVMRNTMLEAGVTEEVAGDDETVEQRAGDDGERFATQVMGTQLDRVASAVEASDNDPALMVAAVVATFPSGPSDPRIVGMSVTSMGESIGAGQTEAILRIMNAGAPMYGTMWASQRDADVRDSHAAVDGMVVFATESFPVGSCLMRWPCDTSACGDVGEFANCRCVPLAVQLK